MCAVSGVMDCRYLWATLDAHMARLYPPHAFNISLTHTYDTRPGHLDAGGNYTSALGLVQHHVSAPDYFADRITLDCPGL